MANIQPLGQRVLVKRLDAEEGHQDGADRNSPSAFALKSPLHTRCAPAVSPLGFNVKKIIHNVKSILHYGSPDPADSHVVRQGRGTKKGGIKKSTAEENNANRHGLLDFDE